ncbi:hypothetical protein O3M35_010158 [Rhynocoris fuscipes]|uniref:Uncharacterized protein n=1 Tax=Rhynocoris fuscipes TaxID=488301 RepID=A0AAW1D5L4_9HEMI
MPKIVKMGSGRLKTDMSVEIWKSSVSWIILGWNTKKFLVGLSCSLDMVNTKFATLSCSVGNTVGPINLKF